MNEDLISIIIPVYNRKKFIAGAIDSVLAQTYKNLELIIVDDGSTDNLGEVLERYKDYQNVRIFNNENHGCSYSRNYGIEKSRGKYILFVDSDDWIEKDMVETLYEKIKEENSDVVICGIAMGNHRENDIIKMIPRKSDSKYFWLSDDALVANPVNKLFKKEIIIREQLRFPEDTHCGEDLCFSICYLLNCKSISLIKKCLYNYELHGENSIYDLKKGKGLFISFRKVYEYIQSKNLQSDKELMEKFSYLSKEHIKSSFKRLLTDRKNFRINYEEYKKSYHKNINFYNSKIKRELSFYIIMILFCFVTRTTFFITMKDSIKSLLKKIILKPYIEWGNLH